MKKIIIISLFTLTFYPGFSQFGYLVSLDTAGGPQNSSAVAYDTSDYQSLRNRIKDQSFFIRLDSNNLNAYVKRSMLRFQVNDFAGSIKDYDKIIQWVPNSTEAYSNRGMDYCMLKNYKAALADMNKALLLSPDPLSYKMRSLVKLYDKDYAGAIADLDSAIAMKPDYVDAYCNKGATEVRMGKCKEAINDYNTALTIDPKFWEAYAGRSEAELKLKDYDGTINDSKKEMELKPDCGNFDFYNDLAKSYEMKGDKINAKLNYEKAATYKNKK